MSEQGVGKKPREFWIDPIEDGDDGEIQVYQAISKHPRQGPLQWQESLIHVIEYSAFEQLEKEKAELMTALSGLIKFTNEICEDIGISVHYPSLEKSKEVLSKLGGGMK